MMELEDAPEVLPTKTETILILDEDSSEVARAIQNIIHELPAVDITRVGSIQQYRDTVEDKDFDIVILDYDVSGAFGVELIHELKLKDFEPAVLILSSSVESRVLTEIYNYGCHRYLLKGDNRWAEHLGPAVRHLLRLRKLENENRNLVAKLTEANIALSEKNRRLDEFSATVAHDIRGPLGGICMKLEYVLDMYGAQFDERLTGLLSRAHSSSMRLTHIVQAMYELAKLGSKAARMQMVSLKTLVEEVVQDLAVDDKLDITVGIGELPEVWASADLLRRVFSNLIANAIKYNDKKEVVINVGCRLIEQKTLCRYAQIFVEDNGPGIPEESQSELFSIFSRGVNHSSTKEGLGIGLSVVQRIIELHFGKVWIESKMGEGTTFIFTLPVDEISFIQ